MTTVYNQGINSNAFLLYFVYFISIIFNFVYMSFVKRKTIHFAPKLYQIQHHCDKLLDVYKVYNEKKRVDEMLIKEQLINNS